MSEISVISEQSRIITQCPVFEDEDGLPVPCNRDLVVIAATRFIGDEYGSWPVYDVYFECGHSFEAMKISLRHADEV